MFPQAWQVGLDIQIDCVRAVAAQRRRNGWQLRHWWQQALPQAVLRDGCLEPSEFLIRALRQWRVKLPRHISLRIALPAQRVLQQRMARPDARLREPERSDYIGGHGLKQFPLDGQTLALDYRAAPADEATLLLTAARRQELQQWLHCLRQAGLHPQAVDIHQPRHFDHSRPVVAVVDDQQLVLRADGRAQPAFHRKQMELLQD